MISDFALGCAGEAIHVYMCQHTLVRDNRCHASPRIYRYLLHALNECFETESDQVG
jgi:hypothetical protein